MVSMSAYRIKNYRVGLDDLASNGGVDITGGLNGLHGAERLTAIPERIKNLSKA